MHPWPDGHCGIWRNADIYSVKIRYFVSSGSTVRLWAISWCSSWANCEIYGPFYFIFIGLFPKPFTLLLLRCNLAPHVLLLATSFVQALALRGWLSSVFSGGMFMVVCRWRLSAPRIDGRPESRNPNKLPPPQAHHMNTDRQDRVSLRNNISFRFRPSMPFSPFSSLV